MPKLEKTSEKQAVKGKFPPGNKIGPRFKPGVSGNPNGRPRITKITEAIRDQIQQEHPDAPEHTIAELVAKKLISMALQGDLGAIREVLDRTEGRAPVTLDVGNKDGAPLLITFDFNSNARLKDGNS